MNFLFHLNSKQMQLESILTQLGLCLKKIYSMRVFIDHDFGKIIINEALLNQYLGVAVADN